VTARDRATLAGCAAERAPLLAMIRLAIRVARRDAEIALAELLALAPAGVEEVDDGDTIEYALYGAPGELPALPDLRAAVGTRASRPRRVRRRAPAGARRQRAAAQRGRRDRRRVRGRPGASTRVHKFCAFSGRPIRA